MGCMHVMAVRNMQRNTAANVNFLIWKRGVTVCGYIKQNYLKNEVVILHFSLFSKRMKIILYS